MVLISDSPSQPVTFKCTVDLQSSEVTYGEGLEYELAQILRKEIDWEIQSDILKRLGWVSVKSNVITDEIVNWSQATIKGRYEFHGNHWMFENAKDASHFILKWA